MDNLSGDSEENRNVAEGLVLHFNENETSEKLAMADSSNDSLVFTSDDGSQRREMTRATVDDILKQWNNSSFQVHGIEKVDFEIAQGNYSHRQPDDNALING